MPEKVVITAANTIHSLGLTLEEGWKALLQGKSGVRPIRLFDASGLETRFAAQLPDTFDEYSRTVIKKRTAKQMTRVTRMALSCAKEAIRHYQIPTDYYQKDRCAVIIGVVTPGYNSIEKKQDAHHNILKGMNNAVSAWISLEYGFEGPNFTTATACASSAYAIAMGFNMIQAGMADMVITGGADSTINPEEIQGFNALYALSTENTMHNKASKPFSKDRDGFVIGEGAGILVLESEKGAKARGGMILAELAGYALTSEAYNIMAPKEQGEGMYLSMKKALDHAGVNPRDIDHINAHGTGTTLNDLYETLAIKKLFGERAYQLPVTSSKSMIGHTIGAAGVIEAAITTRSLQEQRLHPTINLDNPDPALDLDYVTAGAREHNMHYALSNSFAFGGHNATLVLKKR